MRRIDAPFLIAIAAPLIALPTSAYAYLDPGTGSILLQMLLGGIAGTAVVAKLYWAKFTDFFRGSPSKRDTRKKGEE